MHGDGNPVPPAASEAVATTKSEETNGNSSVASAAEVAPLCAFAPNAAAAATFGERCLASNCGCAEESQQQHTFRPCPKNGQAGPLTGEGRRSGPNPAVQTAIPHHCTSDGVRFDTAAAAVALDPSAAVDVKSMLVPSSGSIQMIMTTTTTTTMVLNNNSVDHNDSGDEQLTKVVRRKKTTVARQPVSNWQPTNLSSPVSSRLRSRSVQSDSGCGLESWSRAASSCGSFISEVAHPTSKGAAVEDTKRCIFEDPIPIASQLLARAGSVMEGADGGDDGHDARLLDADKLAEAEREQRKRFGSDILRVLADKINSRKGRKKALLNHRDLNLLNRFNSSLLSSKPLTVQQQCPQNNNNNSSNNNNNKVTPAGSGSVRSQQNNAGAKRLVNSKKQQARTKMKENGRIDARKSSVVPATLRRSPETPQLQSVLDNPSQKPKSVPLPPRWSNGWSWEGSGYSSVVHMGSDDVGVQRQCYPAMRHRQGDVIRVRDCILLKSGTKVKDLPFVAKVSALWQNDDDGEMMMSILWYYRPEHTDCGRRKCDLDDEIFASRHRDVCSVACIEDQCFVLTFNEYCRYRKQLKMNEQGITQPTMSLVPRNEAGEYPRHLRLPSVAIASDRVFLCRKVYDFRQKRILKNPN